MHGRHRGPEVRPGVRHQGVEQVARPATGENVVQARAAILGRLQIDQLVQQGGGAQAAFDPNGAQLGLQAAAGPFLVLEIFAEGHATLGVPGVEAGVRHGDLNGLTRLAGLGRADPAGDVQPACMKQVRHLFQRDGLALGGDHAMIVVHRRTQRLHRSAAFLMREEADDPPAAPKHGHGRARTDAGGDLRIVPAEIGTGQGRIGRRPVAPQGDRGGVHRLRAHDLDLQRFGHARPHATLGSKVHSRNHAPRPVSVWFIVMVNGVISPQPGAPPPRAR